MSRKYNPSRSGKGSCRKQQEFYNINNCLHCFGVMGLRPSQARITPPIVLSSAAIVPGWARSCQEARAANHPPTANIKDAIRTINEIFIRLSPLVLTAGFQPYTMCRSCALQLAVFLS
jgi:hypothetical protein